MGNPAKAIEYHTRCLEFARKTNSKVEHATASINLGFDYLQAHNYLNASSYAKEGLATADTLKNLKLQIEAARILSEAFTATRDYEKALRYHKLYKQFSDSLTREQNFLTLNDIQTRYDVSRKENEINTLKIDKALQEAQVQKLRSRNLLFVAVILIITLVLAFFFYRARANRRISNRLREINETKSRFFANLSHEFRTPLTLMIGPAEKLIATSREKERPWLELIHRNALRLLFLDEQLLEFTRIDSGVQKLQLVSGDIMLAAKVIANGFVMMAEKKGVTFRMSFPETPVKTLFDPDILEKTLGNLISNAIKYTPEGGTVVVKAETVMFEAVENVCFEVADTGPGIPADKQELIFERFYQLGRDAGNSYGGTGIGLALTRELILLHHGAVTLNSKPGGGSVFTIRIPLDTTLYSKEETAAVKPWKESGGNLQAESVTAIREIISDRLTPDQEPGPDPTVKILIVEDHNDMRAYLKAILQEHYQVFEASNGTMGLSEARRIKPDLVLTDIMMEETDGLDLCNLLRADQETSHIPVIMLTALHTMADRVRGLDTGADDYITKPFNELELLARIRTLLNRRSILMAMFSNEFRIEAPAPAIQSADARFIQRLIDIVDQHMDNPDFDVNILSESAGLSRSQLHRRLTEITGKSATGFIRVIRMKRAAQFLELGAGNISEAMYSVGFDNLSYFSKCFREVYGMSPGEYQDLKKRELKSQNETKSGKKLDNSTEMLVPKTT